MEIYFDEKRERLPEYIPFAKLFEETPQKRRVRNAYDERLIIQKSTDEKRKQLISVVPQVFYIECMQYNAVS